MFRYSISESSALEVCTTMRYINSHLTLHYITTVKIDLFIALLRAKSEAVVTLATYKHKKSIRDRWLAEI